MASSAAATPHVYFTPAEFAWAEAAVSRLIPEDTLFVGAT